MSTRMGRISLILLAGVIFAALIAGCQPQPAATTAPQSAGNSQNQAYPAAGAAAQPTFYPAPVTTGQTPVAAIGYPGDMQAQAATQPAGTAVVDTYPGPGAGAGSGPAGVAAAPNQASVVAQFLEQRKSDKDGQVILHVKLLSAKPKSMPDFISQYVDKELDLVAGTGDVPQLAANDQFEAVVSFVGDENGQQFNVRDIKKK